MYGLAAHHLAQLQRHDSAFHCPNGHKSEMSKPAIETPTPTVEQRQELIVALHRAEQAEAVAADAKAKLGRRRRKAVDDHA